MLTIYKNEHKTANRIVFINVEPHIFRVLVLSLSTLVPLVPANVQRGEANTAEYLHVFTQTVIFTE